MSFLFQIFGTRKPEELDTNNINMEKKTENAMDEQRFENVFVNSEEPIKEIAPKTSNQLDDFLQHDYYRQGFNDGYNTHSSDVMKSKVNVIKSEFRNLISHKIDNLRKGILNLEDHLINVEGMDERLEKKLRKRIDYEKEKCQDLEGEKALSALDEGIVMECIHKFNDGYIAGTQQFLDENMLANANGLFD